MLAPGGLVAFTTETHDGEGVMLGEGLRYAHSAAYVRASVAAAGLELSHLENLLRPQRGQRAGAGPGRGRYKNLSLDATRAANGGIARGKSPIAAVTLKCSIKSPTREKQQ